MFRLPRLPAIETRWQQMQLYWQRLVEAIERQEDTQDETINRIRRVLSHTEPTSILVATDDGGIEILPHLRIYGDGTTLSIGGGTQTGFTPEMFYAMYYDDETMADTTPTFVITADIKVAQAVKAEGRHFGGVIKTPASGSGTVIESGGVYALGSSIGGEL